jgi:hypothetical protein
MDLAEGLKQAFRILEEDRLRPTIAYSYISSEWPVEMQYDSSVHGHPPSTAGVFFLRRMRDLSPRPVLEDPSRYGFSSINFDLLLAVFNQLRVEDRETFISTLCMKLMAGFSPRLPNAKGVPSTWDGHSSGLALLTQFTVRTGYFRLLLKATDAVELPTAGQVVMLKQIEDILCLNFNLFNNEQLEQMPSTLAHLREIGRLQTFQERRSGGKIIERNAKYRQGFSAQGNEIVKTIDAITAECAQAQYWYLKGALQQSPNLEIDSDRIKIQSFLQQLGFSDQLSETLDAAERDYRSEATPFELKNCLSHLRSFLEHLHRESAKSIAAERAMK